MGERFGNYEILRRLAAGGMAEVLLAKHKSVGGFERLVCIKRILPHLSAQEEFLKMFQDEARIAANLVHPNIAQIYDISAVDETYFIAMEYVRGEDLRRVYNQEVTHGQTIPSHVAALIIMGAASGLNYAHRQVDLEGLPLNIVHRDISPQNILVTYDGHVKIIDFGVAKAAGKLNQTRAGVLKGKYSYMSPEQASGDPIDGRTDVFALGTTLYEITTGTRLFKRDNELETLHAVIACNVKPPTEVIPNYDPMLEQVVMRALAYDTEARYTTAGEMEHDLERFLMARGHPTSASSLATYMQDLFAEKLADEALFAGHPWQESHGPQRAPFVRPIGESTARSKPNQVEATTPGALSASSPSPAPQAQGPAALGDGADDESTTVDEEPTSRQSPGRRASRAAPRATLASEGTPADWALQEEEDREKTAAFGRSPVAAQPRATDPQRGNTAEVVEKVAPVPDPSAASIQNRSSAASRPGRRVFAMSVLAAFLMVTAAWLFFGSKPSNTEVAGAGDNNAKLVAPSDQDTLVELTGANNDEDKDESSAEASLPTRPLTSAAPAGAATVDILAPMPMAVTLGGHYLGDTPLLGVRLAAGVLRLRLEDHDSGLVIRKSITTQQDKRIRVEVPDRRGRLEVTATPWAWIQLGQRPARETPQQIQLVEGDYEVVLECPDGRRKTELSHVTAGEVAHLSLSCGGS